MGSEEGVNSPFRFMCPLRMPACQRVTQTEKGSGLTLYGPPFLLSTPVHATGFFVFTLTTPPQKRKNPAVFAIGHSSGAAKPLFVSDF